MTVYLSIAILALSTSPAHGMRTQLGNDIGVTGPFDGTMKVVKPPERKSFRHFKEAGGKGTLFEFTDSDTKSDPCITECAQCPASDSPGFEPSNLAAGDFPCLCNHGYREAVKAGDYRVQFNASDLPYEFLLAGAAAQSTAVKRALEKYFLRTVDFVLAARDDGSSAKDVLGKCVQEERGAAKEVFVEAISSIPWDESILRQMEVLGEFAFSVDSLFACLYKLLWRAYQVFDNLASGYQPRIPHNKEKMDQLVDKDFLMQKKKYADWFCQEDQQKDSPCKFHIGVQATKLLHEEHDFSQPFDGWFEWRFVDKKEDASHPPQKGPFTPGFQDTLPDMKKVHVTKSIFSSIGIPFHNTHGEEDKIDSLLRASHGKSWDDENAILPIGSGIAWWEQFDCDCSPLTCQPNKLEDQACEGGFNRVAGRVGGRSVAGPSGTTQKMLQNARLLQTSTEDLYLLRLALIAWMVPAEDHSLLEIFMGAEGSGVPFPHDSRMYSVKALLPGSTLRYAADEVIGHLKELHKRFHLNFDPAQGPRSLCMDSLEEESITVKPEEDELTIVKPEEPTNPTIVLNQKSPSNPEEQDAAPKSTTVRKSGSCIKAYVVLSFTIGRVLWSLF